MSSLFDHQGCDPRINHLPRDGVVRYWGSITNVSRAAAYFDQLMKEIDWKNDEARIFGRHIVTKRKVAWYGDNPFEYKYSGVSRTALPWTALLDELKVLVETHTGSRYNSCLLNLYHDGAEGMAWHSDDERDLVSHGSIASLSFGARRKFAFKHKITKEKVEMFLESGDLLEMKDCTQTYWLHRLPPTKRVQQARINLTFRQMAG